MENANSLKVFESKLNLFLIVVGFFIIGFVCGFSYNKVNNTRPIEEYVNIDSLIKVNDSIKITINKLDSIKDAKIIENQKLDNDSTIKLFYELISK